MKTAISVPDDIFAGVEREAAELKITRSEFFARAAARYIAELESESLTERINAALAAVGEDENLVRDVTAQARRTFLAMDDDW